MALGGEVFTVEQAPASGFIALTGDLKAGVEAYRNKAEACIFEVMIGTAMNAPAKIACRD